MKRDDKNRSEEIISIFSRLSRSHIKIRTAPDIKNAISNLYANNFLFSLSLDSVRPLIANERPLDYMT